MRLLFLNHNIAFSGTFFRAFPLARELVRRGHHVTVVTTSRSRRFRSRWREQDGVRVLEAPDLFWGPGRTGWDPWNAFRRTRLLRRERFDLIHAFDSRPVVVGPALAARRWTGAPLFFDWADWWGRGGRIQQRSGWLVRTFFGPIETWFEEAFRLKALASTVISSALARRLRDLGMPDDRILTIPNGSDADNIVPEDRLESRSILGLELDRPLAVYLGILTPGDMALLLRSFEPAYRETGARLALVGRLPKSVQRMATQPWVTLVGYVPFDRMRQWLAAADLGVVPLRDNPGDRGRWPSKVNDYLCAGRPVVMSDVGDVPSYLRRWQAGWCAAPRPDALGAELTRAFKLGRADLDRAGTQARKLAETELSWIRIGSDLSAFYERMLGGGRFDGMAS